MSAICIHCDSQLASYTQNNFYNGKSRPIKRRHKTIIKFISNGVIKIDYIKLAENLAGQFIKGLPRDIVAQSSKVIGLEPIMNDDA